MIRKTVCVMRNIVKLIQPVFNDNCNHYYYQVLLEKFQPSICNNCHDVLMIPKNLNDISVLNVFCANYCINGISKGEAVNLLQNAVLREKSGLL